MGTRGRKPKVGEIVWSADFAYAVGLMASDGNLSSDGRHLAFVSKDLEQIDNLRKCLNLKVATGITYSGHTGRSGEHKVYYKVQWGDETLYKFFLSIGLTPNKSLTIGRLLIPDAYFFDFLRGQFDGDGCFYSYFDPRWKSSFMFYVNFVSASAEYGEWIRKNIKDMCGVSGSLSNSGKHNKIYNVRYAKSDSLKIISCMYMNPRARCLSRKRLKIVAALRIVGKSLPES